MGMMGMFKWLRKDIQRDRNVWNMAPKQCGLNNESYRNALQAFIDRRRLSEDVALATETPNSPDKKTAEFLTKNNNNHNNNKCDNEWKNQDSKSGIPGVPLIRPSEIFEIGWVAGTEDRYLELIFAEWQNTRVSLKRHTHPECREAVKADLDVLSEIRHPNVLLLMAITQTDDHGLVSIFESVDCTLYNYIHEQGERLCIQGIAKCGGKLSDALRHSHMRGYIHGAISSHCVYLASSGIVKLGGWELAVNVNNPKLEREYDERLRAEIFRWQAPEMYYGSEPQKESDVYGLALLIWEMCTMRVPWSGYSRADVERQYVHWKRGVIMDLYNFPPLLNNLLEAGLQLDVTKRTLDMNRMRRFLQRLEMQYEDEEPVYIDQYANNNNDTGKTYVVPVSRSPGGMPKIRSSKLTKSASAKQLSYSPKSAESPSKQYLYTKRVATKQNTNSKVNANIEHMNFYDIPDIEKRKNKDDTEKNVNVLYSIHNNHKRINSSSGKFDDSDGCRKDEADVSKLLPKNGTYKKGNIKMSKEIESRTTTATSHYSVSSPGVDSTDDESFKDARTSLRQIKEVLANRREHFFYGSDSSHTSGETSPKNEIFAQARSTDYEPHKPASHKTSLEPKCSKAHSQYDPSLMKSSFQQYYKVPYLNASHDEKETGLQQRVSNSDSQGFFETSLWRKEKLICMSRMRKSYEEPHPDSSEIVEATYTKDQTAESNSTTSNNTYTVRGKSKEGDQEICSYRSESIYDYPKVGDSTTEPLQVLKDALTRATEIVQSVTPNSKESSLSPQFKSYQTFEVTEENTEDRQSMFEEIYDLRNPDETEQIRSIEPSSSNNETFLLSSNSFNTSKFTKESGKESSVNTYITSEQSSYDTSHARTFVCESIAEVSTEFNASYDEIDDTEASSKEYENSEKVSRNKKNESIRDVVPYREHKTDTKYESETPEKKSIVTNYNLALLNDSTKHKNCKSCSHSALPRRRSLPAALSQLRIINNSALGKLPIRRADVPDNTVEDLYIDDEFGDSLNVNMILLNEELSFDEDYLPDISEL